MSEAWKEVYDTLVWAWKAYECYTTMTFVRLIRHPLLKTHLDSLQDPNIADKWKSDLMPIEASEVRDEHGHQNLPKRLKDLAAMLYQERHCPYKDPVAYRERTLYDAWVPLRVWPLVWPPTADEVTTNSTIRNVDFASKAENLKKFRDLYMRKDWRKIFRCLSGHPEGAFFADILRSNDKILIGRIVPLRLLIDEKSLNDISTETEQKVRDFLVIAISDMLGSSSFEPAEEEEWDKILIGLKRK